MRAHFSMWLAFLFLFTGTCLLIFQYEPLNKTFLKDEWLRLQPDHAKVIGVRRKDKGRYTGNKDIIYV